MGRSIILDIREVCASKGQDIESGMYWKSPDKGEKAAVLVNRFRNWRCPVLGCLWSRRSLERRARYQRRALSLPGDVCVAVREGTGVLCVCRLVLCFFDAFGCGVVLMKKSSNNGVGIISCSKSRCLEAAELAFGNQG